MRFLRTATPEREPRSPAFARLRVRDREPKWIFGTASSAEVVPAMTYADYEPGPKPGVGRPFHGNQSVSVLVTV